MIQKTYKLKVNDSIQRCPKCNNNIDFICKAKQISEDCCETWIECICGFDPTFGDSFKRFENTWGSTDNEAFKAALSIWNEEIVELHGENHYGK